MNRGLPTAPHERLPRLRSSVLATPYTARARDVPDLDLPSSRGREARSWNRALLWFCRRSPALAGRDRRARPEENSKTWAE